MVERTAPVGYWVRVHRLRPSRARSASLGAVGRRTRDPRSSSSRTQRIRDRMLQNVSYKHENFRIRHDIQGSKAVAAVVPSFSPKTAKKTYSSYCRTPISHFVFGKRVRGLPLSQKIMMRTRRQAMTMVKRRAKRMSQSRARQAAQSSLVSACSHSNRSIRVSTTRSSVRSI